MQVKNQTQEVLGGPAANIKTLKELFRYEHDISFCIAKNDFCIKGQVQGWRRFLTRFPLKFAENNDVGETVI